MASEAGAEPLKGKRDIEKAKALIKEAGYNGERIVLITATDQPIVNAQAQVVAEELRQLGLNVDLQAMDWGTLHQPTHRQRPGRQKWLEYLFHMAGWSGHGESRHQFGVAEQWRKGMVWLAKR